MFLPLVNETLWKGLLICLSRNGFITGDLIGGSSLYLCVNNL